MKCDFCGATFNETEGKSGCSSCPMSKSCQKIKCPNCNYEMYPKPEHKTFTVLKRLTGKLVGRRAKV